MNSFSLPREFSRPFWFQSILALVVTVLGNASPTVAFAAEAETWSVIGQQGVVRFVLVPSEQPAALDTYESQISHLCEPERTCFLNFYTNSTGATPAVPLPDAIADEVTATYRRSMKNGVSIFLWSCRLKVPGRECF